MFKQMQTLAQVSQLTAIYNRVIGEDLYITLKDKLSSAEMMEIIKIVQKLPKQ